MRLTRLLVMVLALWLVGAPDTWAQNQPPDAARDEYVPLEDLPPEAELPAAPMVIAAYVFVWAAFLVYTFTIVRRIRKVEDDLRALERSQKSSTP